MTSSHPHRLRAPTQIQFQKALKAALPNMESPTAGQPIVISAIAPMHGPVVRYSVVELLRRYRHDAHMPQMERTTANAAMPQLC